MRTLPFPATAVRAFTLVEIVITIGVISFAGLALIGLIGTGMQTGRDSEEQIQAANMASLLVSTRASSPTNVISNFAIPATAMIGAYGNVHPDGPAFIGLDGRLTNSAAAAYQMICFAGTNAAAGTDTAQVYIMLSWPAQVDPTNAMAKRYELLTYIPLR